MRSVGPQLWFEYLGVVIAGVVENENHFLVARAAAEQHLQDHFECGGVERRRNGVNELAAT